MTVMEDVRTRIGLDTTDTQYDTLLTSLQSSVQGQFLIETGLDAVPTKLEFIITEVMLVKFNIMRAEGFQSKGQDGYSFSRFSADDFFAFRDTISAYLDKEGFENPMNATVTFIGGDRF